MSFLCFAFQSPEDGDHQFVGIDLRGCRSCTFDGSACLLFLGGETSVKSSRQGDVVGQEDEGLDDGKAIFVCSTKSATMSLDLDHSWHLGDLLHAGFFPNRLFSGFSRRMKLPILICFINILQAHLSSGPTASRRASRASRR